MLPFYMKIDIDFKMKNGVPLTQTEVEALYEAYNKVHSGNMNIAELQKQIEDLENELDHAENHWDCVDAYKYEELESEFAKIEDALDGMWEIIERTNRPLI